MRKELKGAILGIGLSCLLYTGVQAKSVYFTNDNGVEMTELEYNKMTKLYSDEYVKLSLNQATFDKYKNANIIDSETLYQKSTYTRNGKFVKEEYVTKEEYLQAPTAEVTASEGIAPYSGDTDEFETTYKRLSGTLLDFGNNDFSIVGALHWKKVPYCRSYDVFAFRLMNFNYSGFGGDQTYYIGSAGYRINYDTSSPGYQSLYNGAGVSMNLVDGSNITGYDQTIATNLTPTSTSASSSVAFISYQHAQSEVTRQQSMAYTLNVSGYGSVVLFGNSTIASKYDNMSGVALQTWL